MTRPASLVKISEDPSLNTINMGLYGHPGIGKTSLLGSGGKEVLVLDSDSKGVVTLRANGSEASSMPVVDYDQLREAYEFLRHDKHDFKWVWWDSITLFQDRGLVDDILVDAAAQNPRQSGDVASQREYLISQNRIGTYVRLFADLPINFGWTAHVMVGEDSENPDQLIYKPAISGKKGGYSSYICGYMNVVGYYGLTPKGNRRLLTERTGQWYGKDRFHALRTNDRGYIDNPTLPMIERMVAARLTTPSPRRRRTKRKVSS